MRNLLTFALRRNGFDVETAADGPSLLAQCRANPGASAVVTDVRMPGMSGLEVLRQLPGILPRMPSVRVVITAFGDAATHAEAAALGCTCLDKPFDPDDLVELLCRLVDEWSPPVPEQS